MDTPFPGTTLNKLFRTEFEVMDPSEIKQTTTGIEKLVPRAALITQCSLMGEGIWMAPVQGTNIIVLDAEGSDSRERHTQGNAAFERKTLAFTLAHANVLMVTIWKRQVRKSCDGLLSSII